jgi:hypothetical protein
VNDRNWSFRMPMLVDDLRADKTTTARLLRLSGESRRFG